MLNLGKKIVVAVIVFVHTLYGSVVATIDPAVVYIGESAAYTLTITGDKVKKPALLDICGNKIIATSSQTSIEMVNMESKKSYKLTYEFVPTKSCTVAPVAVEVDGKVEKSNPVKVIVKPASQDKNAPFVLTLKTSKENLYVGEPFTLTLELKQNKRASVIDSKFIEPDFKGFWVKGKSEAVRTESDEYIMTRLSYKLAPQREGNLTIGPMQLRIATRMNAPDMWGSFMPQIKWKSYYSNSVKIFAKPLPNNAKLVGDFTITAVADKKKITPNEAVNVTVTVRGDGNLEDIASFKPQMSNVNVFDEKIEIKGNTLTQKLAFVSDENFTIPAFKLAFYNLKKKRVEQIKTEPIKIEVIGGTKDNEKLHIQKQKESVVVKKSNEAMAGVNKEGFASIWLLVTFILGFILGIVFMLTKPFKREKKEKKFNIKDEKLLLIKLLPYKDSDEEVRSVVEALEANIYGHKDEKIDKKVLKNIMKRYDII
jgi:cbb3-type cytochrome oxidase subunit 3